METEKKVERAKRKQSNYILEKKLLDGVPVTVMPAEVWSVVKEGFVSPEAALDYVEEKNLEGIFRAMRVASPEIESKLVAQAPVLQIKKLNQAPKAKKPTALQQLILVNTEEDRKGLKAPIYLSVQCDEFSPQPERQK